MHSTVVEAQQSTEYLYKSKGFCLNKVALQLPFILQSKYSLADGKGIANEFVITWSKKRDLVGGCERESSNRSKREKEKERQRGEE